MKKDQVRIIFYGTAPFATACLERLLDEGYPIVAVVTAPDKPAGRGHRLQPSAVKLCATKLGLPILQPTNLRDEAFVQQLTELKPTLGVVVAFRMLPREVWSLPPWGTVNIHGSLLPQYRGAAPINWALINGESETGVTLFQLRHEIDTGDIIAASACPIEPEDNFGTLYDKLMTLGAELLAHGLSLLMQHEGCYPQALPQEERPDLRPAPKLTKENTRIDWHQSAHEIHNLVRGLAPQPGAWTMLELPNEEPLLVKIYATTLPQQGAGERPVGQSLSPRKGQLAVQCGDGLLLIDQLKPQGKKLLSARDWLNGLKVSVEEVRFV